MDNPLKRINFYLLIFHYGICQHILSTSTLIVHRKNVSLCDNGVNQFNITSDVNVSCSSSRMTSYIVEAGIKRHIATDTSWTDITLALSEACNGKRVCSQQAQKYVQKSMNTSCDDADVLHVSYVCLPGDSENSSTVLIACSNNSAVLKSNSSLFIAGHRWRLPDLPAVNMTYRCKCSATGQTVWTSPSTASTQTVTVIGVVTLNSEENCSQSLEVRSNDASKTVCSSPMSTANKSTSKFDFNATINNFTIEYRQSSSTAQHGVFVLLLQHETSNATVDDVTITCSVTSYVPACEQGKTAAEACDSDIDDYNQSHLSAGAIAGIVAGSLAILATVIGIVLAALYTLRHKRRRQTEPDEKTEERTTNNAMSCTQDDHSSPVYYNVLPDGRVNERPPGDDLLYEDVTPRTADEPYDDDKLYEQVCDTRQSDSQQAKVIADSSLDLTVIDNSLYDQAPAIH